MKVVQALAMQLCTHVPRGVAVWLIWSMPTWNALATERTPPAVHTSGGDVFVQWEGYKAVGAGVGACLQRDMAALVAKDETNMRRREVVVETLQRSNQSIISCPCPLQRSPNKCFLAIAQGGEHICAVVVNIMMMVLSAQHAWHMSDGPSICRCIRMQWSIQHQKTKNHHWPELSKNVVFTPHTPCWRRCQRSLGVLRWWR